MFVFVIYLWGHFDPVHLSGVIAENLLFSLPFRLAENGSIATLSRGLYDKPYPDLFFMLENHDLGLIFTRKNDSHFFQFFSAFNFFH